MELPLRLVPRNESSANFALVVTGFFALGVPSLALGLSGVLGTTASYVFPVIFAVLGIGVAVKAYMRTRPSTLTTTSTSRLIPFRSMLA